MHDGPRCALRRRYRWTLFFPRPLKTSSGRLCVVEGSLLQFEMGQEFMFHNHRGSCFGAGRRAAKSIAGILKKTEVWSKKAAVSVESPVLSHVSTFWAKDWCAGRRYQCSKCSVCEGRLRERWGNLQRWFERVKTTESTRSPSKNNDMCNGVWPVCLMTD